MKKFLYFPVLISLVFLLATCTPEEVDEPKPTKSLANAKTKGELMPDLIIYKLHYTNGDSYPDGLGGRVFTLSISEKNIGTATSTATENTPDEIKVYQRIRTVTRGRPTFTNRYIRSFLRTTDLAPGEVWFQAKNTSDSKFWIYIPREFMPTNRNVDIFFEADGGNSIDELDETNNISRILSVHL